MFGFLKRIWTRRLLSEQKRLLADTSNALFEIKARMDERCIRLGKAWPDEFHQGILALILLIGELQKKVHSNEPLSLDEAEGTLVALRKARDWVREYDVAAEEGRALFQKRFGA